jgi:hypothetical protein
MVVHIIIPATWEAEVGGLGFEPAVGKRPYWRNKLKQKGPEAWFKWYSACCKHKALSLNSSTSKNKFPVYY